MLYPVVFVYSEKCYYAATVGNALCNTDDIKLKLLVLKEENGISRTLGTFCQFR